MSPSRASMACTAASNTPVCPTMSGFAKLRTIRSYVSSLIFSITAAVTSGALISGCRSYVATLGDGISILSSPLFGSSTPPLKKNVTCAYFSVSAIRSCLSPRSAMVLPRVGSTSCGGYATSTLGIVASYSAMHTYVRSLGADFLSNPSKSGSTSARVISLALSGLKLMKITESPSLIGTGLITVGWTNSSTSSFA